MGWVFQSTSSPQTVQASLEIVIARVSSTAATTANRLGYLAFCHCGGWQA